MNKQVYDLSPKTLHRMLLEASDSCELLDTELSTVVAASRLIQRRFALALHNLKRPDREHQFIAEQL
jgi:hypothetical protein